jgi:hypothetical protein
LNIVLRCARRETTARARCIALSSLGQWILQNLSSVGQSREAFKQHIPYNHSQGKPPKSVLNPRITEAFQVILQALQFKHRVIARIAAETLKLCAEQGEKIAQVERLPSLIITTICLALEIQNVPHPKESDKTVMTSLLLCLGEFCMALPLNCLLETKTASEETLIHVVLKVLHKIAMGTHNGERLKLFTTDEDFDMTIHVDDIREQGFSDPYQTAESLANCISAIKLCAKTVAHNLITNLAHFPSKYLMGLKKYNKKLLSKLLGNY